MRIVRFESLIVALLFLGGRPASEKGDYNVAKIPPSLLKNATAVVRKDRMLFEVKDDRRATFKATMAVTVFDKTERDYGVLLLWYDKFSEIEDLDAVLYDADGKEIRDLEDSDVKDYSAFSDYSLYEDSRVRVATMYHDAYPYTIEFTYEISYDGFLNWPTWYAQGTMDAVESSRFEVVTPAEGGLRFWCNRDSVKPVILTEGSRKRYVWADSLLPKLSRDQVGEPEDVTTIVRIAPSSFKIEDHPGSMTTWKDLGLWYHALTVGKDKLPAEEAAKVHHLVDTIADRQSKIETLYKYMQAKTRYVNVTLGIGGWEPYDASYVCTKGYGDCKALSNYMSALLKEAGVKSSVALLYSGSSHRQLIGEFPSNQFNHVIVCVPMEHDSLWLECTSQTMPMGHLGRETENRGALLITDEGGIVVRTPESFAQDNTQWRRGTVRMMSAGNAEVRVFTSVTGDQQDHVRDNLSEASPTDRERWILEDLQLQNAALQQYDIEGLESHGREISLGLNLTVSRMAGASGSRLFFQPNLFERRTNVPPDVIRLSPVRFSYPYLDRDSIYYQIPSFFVPEAVPDPVTIKSSFGSFSSSTVALGDTALIFRRRLKISSRSVPPDHYGEYRKFFADIVKADRRQVVLVRKTSE